MNFRTMTVRAKLTLAFGALAALVLIVAVVAVKSLWEANDQFVDFVRGINARAQVASEIGNALDRRAIAARNLVLVTRPEDIASEKADVLKAHEEVQQRISRLQSMIAQGRAVPEKAKSLVDEIAKLELAYGPVAQAIVDLALSHKHEQAVAKMNDECRPLLAALSKKLKEYSDFTQARADALVDAAASEYAMHRNLLILACVVAFTAAGVAGVLITRSITQALGAEPAALGGVAAQVAQGDLSPIASASAAPKGSVLSSLAAMQASLAGIVGQVRSSSDSIATGSSQIALGNADLSQRTEEQASNLQQTAASMEELSGTVKNNAQSAERASELAVSAAGAAAKGGDAVTLVVRTMEQIAESSKDIADIISVIDGIAFQTNILALNAAVEAARAGEQGRGFAVVAGEVRILAGRSAQAAKEIKTLIGASVEKVELGSRQVSEAGASMNEIVVQVQRVSSLISEISGATAEQSTGIGQVGDAVAQLDQVTQQNAALVEESAAAAESLKHQAAALARVVSVFKLSGESELRPALVN